MGTRNFTSVILDGKQVVCQYCQWDGYPTYAGVKILEFLRDVNMERFKEALRNTKITLTNWEEAGSYTGSTKKVSEVYKKVDSKQSELNKNRQDDDDYFGTYKTVMLMLKNGELTPAEVDDFIVSTRDTGCDILPFIYERSLDAAPLELFAMKEEFDEVLDFATNKDYVGFPGCDAQGYYMINLDNNTIKLAFDDYVCEYNLAELPQNIDKEMLVFEKITYELYQRCCDGVDFASLIPSGEDVKGAGGLLDLATDIAVGIGTSIREESPEVLGDNTDMPICAEDFGQELIYKFLREAAEVQRTEKEKNAATLNELKEYIEGKGWSVSDCTFGGDVPGWELSQHSPAGEDFSFSVEHKNNVSWAIEEIRDYAEGFDVEEHVQMLVEARRNGFAGVPDTKTLVNDADAIKVMLLNLADDVERRHPSEKKLALDDVIGMCKCDYKSGQQHTSPSHDVGDR